MFLYLLKQYIVMRDIPMFETEAFNKKMPGHNGDNNSKNEANCIATAA